MSAQVYKAMKDLLNEKGYQGIMIDCSHISEIQDRFHSMRHQDMFDHGFYEKELLGLEFDMVDRIPWLESIIIVAMPQPRYELTFWIEEKPFPAIIPPQYLASDELIVKKRLAPWMAKQGYRMAQVELPMKHLAVHSGLAYYGRNNLAYIPGMGSFLRLMAFVTDLPCHDDQWGERRLLDRCQNCTACQKCCPTKALDTDRFLLHAERCLTYHNESVDDFPEWIDSSWHHCLVGCMRCQEICPENRAFKQSLQKLATFSSEETHDLLSSSGVAITASRKGKCWLDFAVIRHKPSIVPRNLRALVVRQNPVTESVK